MGIFDKKIAVAIYRKYFKYINKKYCNYCLYIFDAKGESFLLALHMSKQPTPFSISQKVPFAGLILLCEQNAVIVHCVSQLLARWFSTVCGNGRNGTIRTGSSY